MEKIAVIPGFSATSLSTMRCLAYNDIKIYLVGLEKKKGPAYYSNIPVKKILYNYSSHFIDCLIKIGKELAAKAVLLLTEDVHVIEIANNINTLQKYYHFLLPPQELVNLLMDKALFCELAIKKGFKIPRTKIVSDQEELFHIEEEFPYPFMLKPYMLHSKKIHSFNELIAYIDTFEDINYSSMIVQEWIPGEDDQLYFCFLFFDNNSNVIVTFLGRKLRQYPHEFGTTSYCVSCDNQLLIERSIKIFSELHHQGFCSIEYKYDKTRNEYYIMEPTVGRFNLQVALTMASGINFPIIMFNYLCGEKIQTNTQIYDKYWMYETNDFFSLVRSHNSSPLRKYFKDLKDSDIKVLYSKSDFLPLFWELYDMLLRKIKKTKS
ncbi:MAG: hypothetical protein A2Y62_02710 [Candidatus Fischerbacteria bacterium RBG_13_37_8]|uniref:ATP-grasp domain-containing protein n=1 Tax=Candidatus Fischerbacteria bacterium RBG_13_37_8 TaxID=1817863 RepID=A0A1F5VXQ5_9BACT|nr:MAG: hypothetical protein A2Y62_02710 [Candidatus Fischerbacteria bacterium RBG_13_37_8]